MRWTRCLTQRRQCWLTILHGIHVEENLIDGGDLDGLRDAVSAAARSLGLTGDGLAQLRKAFGGLAADAIGVRRVLLWHDRQAVYCQLTYHGTASGQDPHPVSAAPGTDAVDVDVVELSGTTPGVATIAVPHLRQAVPA
ncbi:hypothetical protein [Catellatospora sp. NPDC049609]|uniref:hypothetical protein n=1 Tax=Catellatospora sp. NPDC049609 TaxID=3155505 RepID=UPI003427366B